jgi:TatD DNase family protein
LEKTPIGRIVVETDAPYLSPEPLRGKTNYPQNIIYILEKISEVKNIELKKLTEQIFRNTLRILKLKNINECKKNIEKEF